MFIFQEFGDSARARKLYEQDSDDDDDEEIEPNPKLEQGKPAKDNFFLTCLFFTPLFILILVAPCFKTI